jgi:hypothetical protein
VTSVPILEFGHILTILTTKLEENCSLFEMLGEEKTDTIIQISFDFLFKKYLVTPGCSIMFFFRNCFGTLSSTGYYQFSKCSYMPIKYLTLHRMRNQKSVLSGSQWSCRHFSRSILENDFKEKKSIKVYDCYDIVYVDFQ